MNSRRIREHMLCINARGKSLDRSVPCGEWHRAFHSIVSELSTKRKFSYLTAAVQIFEDSLLGFLRRTWTSFGGRESRFLFICFCAVRLRVREILHKRVLSFGLDLFAWSLQPGAAVHRPCSDFQQQEAIRKMLCG